MDMFCLLTTILLKQYKLKYVCYKRKAVFSAFHACFILTNHNYFSVTNDEMEQLQKFIGTWVVPFRYFMTN